MRMQFTKTLALLTFAVTTTAWAQQSVYRCGNSYRQTPCEGGQEIALDEPRPASAKIESDRTNQRIAQEAQAMEKARLQREAQFLKQANLAAKQNENLVKSKAAPTQEESAPVHRKVTKKKSSAPKPFTAKGEQPDKVSVKSKSDK